MGEIRGCWSICKDNVPVEGEGGKEEGEGGERDQVEGALYESGI